MSDHLEDFVKKNREEFDVEVPASELWARIESELPGKRGLSILRISGIAASIIILISAGYFFGVKNTNNQINAELFANQTQYKEFKEAQDYYTTEIGLKIKEVQTIGVDSEVMDDLKQLDEVYEELKAEMLKSNEKDKEGIINLLINSYQTKIEILERIINKTKELNQQKINNNETINI